jgi:hypothetical protein
MQLAPYRSSILALYTISAKSKVQNLKTFTLESKSQRIETIVSPPSEIRRGWGSLSEFDERVGQPPGVERSVPSAGTHLNSDELNHESLHRLSNRIGAVENCQPPPA